MEEAARYFLGVLERKLVRVVVVSLPAELRKFPEVGKAYLAPFFVFWPSKAVYSTGVYGTG